MTRVNTKRNKKEDRKKLMVRIMCWVMVAALLLTSGLAMMSWLFQDNSYSADIQAMIDAGILVDNGDGTLTVVDMEAFTGAEGEGTHVHEDGTVHDNETDALLE